MASKGTKITDRERKLIIADYILGNSMHFLSRKHKRSVSTIKRIVDAQKIEQPEQYANAVEQLKIDNTTEVLNSIADNKSFRIIEKYKDVLLSDDNIQNALNGTAKLQQFINGIGMLYDKSLKYKQIVDEVDVMKQGINVKVVNDARPSN
jgi:hypothetical protein